VESTVKIEDQFRVPVPVDEAWSVLLDVERIAPCMPGAQLQEVEGDEYRGIVKVKVGPITAQYKGAARIVEADEGARRIVIKAEGRDTRGQGNASATVTASLAPDADGTQVSIDTDLNVTGKVAQFGRGVMADVSSKLLGQFVSCLETNVLAGDAVSSSRSGVAGTASSSEEPAQSSSTTPATPLDAGAAPPASGSSSSGSTSSPSGPGASAGAAASGTGGVVGGGARKIDAPEAEAVDLMKAAGGAVAKRVVPAAIVAAVVIALVVWLVSR
jgi:carbon monoxide dehydrogenase subunit G